MKVKTTKYPSTHCISHCYECNFKAEYGGYGSEYPSYLDVHAACKKHVAETGHSVSVEQALATRYSPPPDPSRVGG